MEDIRLPGPQTRIVMLGDNVFKLKYKLSNKCSGHSFCSSKNIQDDIKNTTEAILNLLSSTGKLVSIRTTNVVIFPGSLPWKKQVCDKLHFSYKGHKLQAHPQIIFLLIHILTPMSPKTPTLQIAAGTHSCVTPRRPGKRNRTVSYHPDDDDEQLPLMAGIPSSIVLARKKLKMENGCHTQLDTHAQIPQESGSIATLPMESAHSFSESGKQNNQAPDVEHIAQCAELTKKRLHDLSQPSTINNLERDTDREDLNGEHSSVFHRLVGSMKSFFGW